MGRGRKQKRNITGLRNQPKPAPPPENQDPIPEQASDGQEDRIEKLKKDVGEFSQTGIGSIEATEDEKVGSYEENVGEVGIGKEQIGWDELEQEEPHGTLIEPVWIHVDNPRDTDWVPEELRKKAKMSSKGPPAEYVKGPDVANKSDRTKRRYQNLLKDQTALNKFGFTVAPHTNKGLPQSSNSTLLREGTSLLFDSQRLGKRSHDQMEDKVGSGPKEIQNNPRGKGEAEEDISSGSGLRRIGIEKLEVTG